MKVMSIVGTRPEIIKMSEIIKKLDKHTEHTFIHTGQNYDYALNEIFYKDLDLRKPDHILDTKGDSLAETVGNIMFEVEKMLKLYEPDAVVILGDTNSALSGIIVKRMKIPLFHLEAGNRCFDDNVPEEINRRIMDHISDVNLVYTQGQRLYLRDEGIAKDRLFIMGSPMKEVFSKHMDKINSSSVLKDMGLEYPEAAMVSYFLVSLHRDENTEIPENLTILLDTLDAIAKKYELPVIVSTHPRLRKKLRGISLDKKVRFVEPLGYLDYNKLQMNAKCVISDSGTIAEESAILGFPAITIRNAHERAEATDAGSILMTGVNKENILDCLEIIQTPTTIPDGYNVENCSDRVLKVVLGYTPYVNKYVWRKR
jgi:UDP-N-acetylglucosamine 2-epimerase (non-hydrolysing)